MQTEKYTRLIQRMEVQAKLTWNREIKLIQENVADPKDKLKILEIGSGPGVITKKLCELFPNAQITCLELDSDFVEYSKTALPDDYKERVEILKGDITQIDLDEEVYDIVYARLVLQHVHGVDKALENAHKALKKGGQILITDIDEGLFGIIDPEVPELSYVYGQHIQEQVLEGGDRYIGRKLWRMLKNANFSTVDLDLIPVNSDEVGINSFLPQVDYEEMGTMIDNDLLSQDDIDKVKIAADKFLQSDYPFALLVLFFVVGTK
ncbi:methyltransferase domain-containing protein [Streptococcus mutans]|uniref:class I SAM-dependent methyltransferase n=1 Tax=Streptococcus mutans TaxID=1309 RepID=UPI0022846C5D|nr:class I SAM-dependent methyltransferase [Streptococcus mutans]MCY7118522.1 methyltransferase domain-containing protein [Streptococcus mutans]